MFQVGDLVRIKYGYTDNDSNERAKDEWNGKRAYVSLLLQMRVK